MRDAELNAILNCNGKSLHRAKLYVAFFSCNECAKAIIQAGITEVVYFSDKYKNTPATRASKRILKSAGVMMRRMKSDKNEITLNFQVEA